MFSATQHSLLISACSFLSFYFSSSFFSGPGVSQQSKFSNFPIKIFKFSLQNFGLVNVIWMRFLKLALSGLPRKINNISVVLKGGWSWLFRRSLLSYLLYVLTIHVSFISFAFRAQFVCFVYYKHPLQLAFSMKGWNATSPSFLYKSTSFLKCLNVNFHISSGFGSSLFFYLREFFLMFAPANEPASKTSSSWNLSSTSLIF